MVIETDDSTATGRPDGLLYLLSRCQKTLSSMLNHVTGFVFVYANLQWILNLCHYSQIKGLIIDLKRLTWECSYFVKLVRKLVAAFN